MLAWSAALALVAILALFVPRRQLLLLGIAAVAGIATPGLFDWRGSQGLVQMIWLIFSLCFANGHEGNRSNQT